MRYPTAELANEWLNVMLKLGHPKPSGSRPGQMDVCWGVDIDLSAPPVAKDYTQIVGFRIG
jgi:hypothetical protein